MEDMARGPQRRHGAGPTILGGSTICLGLACLMQKDFAIYWQPVPEGFPLRQPLAFVSAALLIASGLGLLTVRGRLAGAITQFVLFAAYALAWTSITIRNGSVQPWLGIAENLAIALGAATIWARLQSEIAASIGFTSSVARGSYAVFSTVFALAHVVSVESTANLIPSWFPGDASVWAILTGGLHLAVAFALAINRLAVLATRLGAAMYCSFAAIIWLPGAVAHPDHWLRWAGLAISLTLAGALWLVGDYSTSEKDERPSLESDKPSA